MADGLAYVEAIQNAEIAINEWVETAQLIGWDIPFVRERLVYA
jgi:predicted RNase H-like HicB family nuclease